MADESILEGASPEQLEAFVQIVVLVAYADGDLSVPEEQMLVKRVQTLAGGRLDPEHLQDLMVELPPMSRGSDNWRADRINDLKKDLADETLRRAAFSVAVDVAKSDRGIGFRETRMLVNVVSELDIDVAYAREKISGKSS